MDQPSHTVNENGVILSKRRWFIVIAIAFLNLSNALTWNSFATVAASTKDFYNVSFGAVNMLSVVYMIISIPVGFFAIWSLDSLGLRLSITVAAIANAIGPILRYLSTFDFIDKSDQYTMLIIGQCIAAFGQTFIMFCPPKVAQYWFPDNHRALANTVASMANPLGILLSAVLAPVILQKPDDMSNLMLIFGIPSEVALVVTLFSLTRSKPEHPPSESACQESEPFLQGLKIILKNKMFLLLMVCFGSGMAIFTALAALIMQILCPYGYNESYAGMSIGIMVGVGIVGAAVTGIIADITKQFVEVAKVSLALAAAVFCFFTVILVYPQQYVLLAFSIGIFGFFGFGQYAICLELAIETTFPVAEATSAGLMVITGQILSAVMVLVMQPLGVPIADRFDTCSANATQGEGVLSYVYGNILLCCLAVVAGSALICFYQCPYKRLEFERKAAAQKAVAKNVESPSVNPVSHGNEYSATGNIYNAET